MPGVAVHVIVPLSIILLYQKDVISIINLRNHVGIRANLKLSDYQTVSQNTLQFNGKRMDIGLSVQVFGRLVFHAGKEGSTNAKFKVSRQFL